MGEIYCLYSSEDGMPSYVEMTEEDAEKRWKRHLASALDLAPGVLYDWIRGVVRRNGYVGMHILQSGILAADLAFYESYWISQFSGLLDVRENAVSATVPSELARQVTVQIKAKLVAQSDSA